MSATNSDTKTPRSRSEVRREYGHPWPWMSKRILEREYIAKDRTAKELAEAFRCNPNTISEAASRLGLSKEGGK